MTTQSVTKSDYYVYALFREDGITPFYIGKGRDRRILIHERDASRNTTHKDRIIQSMRAAGIQEIPKAKLADGLTDREAKRLEIDLIHLIVRWPKGPLANLTSGGDGVESLSPESAARKAAGSVAAWNKPGAREKRIAINKAVWTAEKRKAHSQESAQRLMLPEIRAKMSAGRKAAGQRPEVRAAHVAANGDPKVRAAKSAAMVIHWQDPETRAHRTAAIRKVANDPIVKQKHSEKAKAMWANPEIRAKILLSRSKNPPPRPSEATMRALLSPETKAKSLATRRLPEVMARRSASQKAAFATPEAKERRSAASKAMWVKRKHQNAVPSAKPQLP